MLLSAKHRLPLKESIKKYWFHFVGLIAFVPALSFIQTNFKEEKIEVLSMMILFFSVAVFAAWPVTRKEAPYSFWLVAGIIWISSAVCWTLLGVPLN